MLNLIHNTNEDLPEAISHARNFIDTFAPLIPKMFRELMDICKDADLIVSTPFQLAAKMVHEKLGIPLVSVLFTHFGVSGSKLLRENSAPILNEYRAREGLKPLHDPLTVDALSDDLVLFAVSKYILRKAPTWPDHYRIAGFFYLDEQQYTPDPDLEAFMGAGSPPVVISFGSMVHSDADATMRTLVEAVRQTGERAVIQKGWSDLSADELPPNIFLAEYLPHSWLFPQAACIVHHGGAGTSAAAFRSGNPSIFVPHALDQPLWAQMGVAVGCANEIIPLEDLEAGRLADAIRSTLANEKLRMRSQKMSKKLNSEMGIQEARKAIEALTYAEVGV